MLSGFFGSSCQSEMTMSINSMQIVGLCTKISKAKVLKFMLLVFVISWFQSLKVFDNDFGIVPCWALIIHGKKFYARQTFSHGKKPFIPGVCL